MECSGRTQRSRPEPQRIDFGQGKLRTISGTMLGHDLCGGTARLLDRRDVVGALLVVALLGLIDRGEPRRFEEAFDRGLGRIDARTLPLLAHIGRRDGRPSTTATSRRGVAKVLISLNSSPRLAERPAEQPREILARARLHSRRDLFGEQFKQELSHFV